MISIKGFVFSIVFLMGVIGFSGCNHQDGSIPNGTDQIRNLSSPTKAVAFSPIPTNIIQPTETIDLAASETVTSMPTIQETLPEPTITATLAPTNHHLQNLLPNECLYEMAEFPEDLYKSNFRYDVAQACKYPVLSPDHTFIAYATYKRIGETDRKNSATEVVKIVNLEIGEPIEIYQTKKNSILNLDWSSNGKLIIQDASIEYVYSVTVIYDPVEMRIIQEMSGLIRDPNGWNDKRTAFYTLDSLSPGPVCWHSLGGFDFISGRQIPSLKVFAGSKEIVRIMDGPYWIQDGNALILTVRQGNENHQWEDITYGPSTILEIWFTQTGPRMIMMKYDPQIDFVLHWKENRNL